MTPIIQIIYVFVTVVALAFLAHFMYHTFSKKDTTILGGIKNKKVDEPFITISTDVFNTKELKHGKGIAELKEKLRQFEQRNRFYNLE